jgi:hypothetical protein
MFEMFWLYVRIFGTAYFVRVAMLLEPPEEFSQYMQQRWGWTVEPGSKVFDLFR